MGNMSYVRFQNTLPDLRDCAEHMDDALGGAEFRSRAKLIALCKKIADDWGGVEFVDADEDEE